MVQQDKQHGERLLNDTEIIQYMFLHEKGFFKNLQWSYIFKVHII